MVTPLRREEDDPVGVGEDGGDVRGKERLIVPDADDERHVLAGADQAIGLGAVHDRDGVGTLGLAEGGTDGLGEVALVGLLDQMRERLRVGLGGQPVATGGEPVAELPEVLDDAVVDDRDLARAVLVGMSVEVIGAAMGGPAGVGQADRRMGRAVGDGRAQVGELAGLLLDEQAAGIIDEGDARRVVAAVLEPLQAFDEDRARLAGPRIADDAAHPFRSSLCTRVAVGTVALV